jgi:TP901 family phage tail tape measure protein
MSAVGNLVINLMGNTQHLSKSLTRSKTMISSFSRTGTGMLSKFGKVGGKVFGAVGGAAKKMGAMVRSAGSMIATAAVMGTGMAIAKTIEYDDALRSAGAKSRATEKGLADLDDRAKMLGRTTSFTATEVVTLMEELGKGGFKVPEIMDVTDDVMNLARATGTEGAMAAKLMATSMRVFGLESAEAGRVADVFTAVSTRTLTSVEELAEGWKFAAKPAADLGMSIEETAAMMGTLAQMGLKGSIAGTAIRRLATISASQADKMEKKFGIAFKDSAGAARPLIDVMSDISNATSQLGSADRMTEFYEAFGLRGVTATSGLADNVAQTDALVAALEGAGGEAQRVSTEMDAGIGGSWRRFKSAVEGAALQFGEMLTPTVIGAMESIKSTINGWTEWLKENWTSVTNKIAELWLMGMTYIEFTWNNMGALFEIVMTGMTLAVVAHVNRSIHFWTVVLPTAVSWFGENFYSILFNVFETVSTLFINLGHNIRAMWKAVTGFIAGEGWNLDLKPLFDDLKTVALTTLDIPERVKGDIEQKLEANLDALTTATGNSLDNMMSDRLATLHQMQDEAAAKKLDDTQPEDPVGKVRTAGEGSAAGPSGTSAASVAGAQMRGSAEAMMTILNAAGAQTDEMQLKIQKKLLKEQTAARKIAEEQEKRARRIEAERERNNGQYLVISGTP